MKHIVSWLFTVSLLIGCLCLLPLKADAATDGCYTYAVNDGNATITDCDVSISGEVTIPATLGGYPVTGISSKAFDNCDKLTAVSIPDSITYIHKDAFYECDKLIYNEYGSAKYLGNSKNPYLALVQARSQYISSTTIHENTKIIASWAYYRCESLKSVIIPDSVTHLNSYAFYTCTKLESVTFGKGIRTIGDSAFGDCVKLKSAMLSDGVTTIGYEAFRNCSGLSSVNIPNSVMHVEYGAFSNCNNLTYQVYENANYLGNQENPYHVLIKNTSEYITSCTIHENARVIADFAFDCKDLKTITIPAGIVAIGDKAFGYCSGLNYIHVDENNPAYSSDACGVLFNKDKTILVQAPRMLSDSYTIPDGVTVIGASSFQNCGQLRSVTIADSVAVIGASAFYHADKLLSVGIGNGVTTIQERAFAYCGVLDSVVIPDSVTTIGREAFANSSHMSSVVIGNGVTEIEERAFEYCYLLKSVKFGSRVKTIGDGAFYDCDLLSLTIPDSVTTIGGNAFGASTSLRFVTIPDSVTAIGDGLFSGCTNLKSVVFGKGVTAIGSDMFEKCEKLTSVILPDGVTGIAYNAFTGSRYLKQIYYLGSQEQWNAIAGNNHVGKTTVLCNATVTGISVNEMPKKQKYLLGEDLDTTGLVLNLEFHDNTSMQIDAGFTTKRYSADTAGEKSVYVFYKDFYTNFTVNVLEAITGTCGWDLTWRLTPDGVLTISGTGVMESRTSYQFSFWKDRLLSVRKVVIQPGATTIGYSVFEGCTNLTSVTIPDTVTRIERGAFMGCTGLEQVTVGEGVYHVGPNAFKNCYRLSSVILPNSVMEIGEAAFRGCNRLTSVAIGEGITNIGASAFYGCTKLPSITIPSSVTTIGKDAFTECSALSDIYASDVRAWLNITFENDTANPLRSNVLKKNLHFEGKPATDIVLPAALAELKSYAFYNCANIRSVVIPVELFAIANSAFSGCTGLEKVYYTGTEAQWADMIIGGGNEPILNAALECGYTIPVPSGDLDGVEGVSEDDAIYLLQAVLMPDLFPVDQTVDFDGNGTVDEDDAIYLLQHVLMPDLFPLI